MSSWFQDGRPVSGVEPDDRGFLYGDGLFETIAIRRGTPRLWALHMERLARGCERLAIATPGVDELRNALDRVLDASGTDTARAIAKIVVTSGSGERGYGRTAGTAPTVRIGIFPAATIELGLRQDGVRVIRCETRLATPSATAGLKTLGRLEQVLATLEVRRAGAFEGLCFDADGRLICGTMSNVFIVEGQSIVTPSVARCGVAGVMRGYVMTTLAEAGQPVATVDVDSQRLAAADALFLTNSQFGVLRIGALDDLRFTRNERVEAVINALAAAGIEECAS